VDTVAAEVGYHRSVLLVMNRLFTLEELRFGIISFHSKVFDMNCFTSLQIYLCFNLFVRKENNPKHINHSLATKVMVYKVRP
jgi:hypothetical protein